MQLNKQLEIERKNKAFSKNQLLNVFEKGIGLSFQVDTVRRWEAGTSTIAPRALAFLSELYDIMTEDLVSENIEPLFDDKEKYYKFGKEIREYCLVENITEFVNKYEVVNNSHWVVMPKSDLIMRCYEDYLKDEQADYFTCNAAYQSCRYWMTSRRERRLDDNKLYNRIYDEYVKLGEKIEEELNYDGEIIRPIDICKSV